MSKRDCVTSRRVVFGYGRHHLTVRVLACIFNVCVLTNERNGETSESIVWSVWSTAVRMIEGRKHEKMPLRASYIYICLACPPIIFCHIVKSDAGLPPSPPPSLPSSLLPPHHPTANANAPLLLGKWIRHESLNEASSSRSLYLGRCLSRSPPPPPPPPP